MGRILKWVIGGFFSLVFLVGLVIFLLVTFVDLNELKPRIETLAKEQASIDLRIPGDLSWSFYPYLGIELGKAQLRPLSTPDANPLASIQKAAVGVALMPLIGGEVKIQRLHLIQPEIYLHRNAEGVANWELVQEALAQTTDAANSIESTSLAKDTDQQAATQTQADTDSNPSMQLNLEIADIWLDKAAVKINDEVEKLDIELTEVSLRAKDVSLDKAFPIEFAAKLALNEPAAQLNLNLETEVKLDLAAEHYALNNLKLKLVTTYPEMLNTPLTLTLDGGLDAQMASGQVKVPLNLSVTAPDWKDVSLPEISTTQLAINADLNLNTQLYLINKLQLDTGVRLDKQSKLLPLKLQATAEANLERQLANLNQQLSFNELQQQLTLEASQLLEEPEFNGLLTLEISRLRKLLTDLGIELPEMADLTTLNQVLATLGFSGDLQKITFNQLDLGFDDTQFKGNAEVKLENLAVLLRLAGDKLDADRYLPPPMQADEKPSEQVNAAGEDSKEVLTAATTADEEELLPVELIKTLNLDIGFNLDKLKISGLNLEKIDLSLTAKDGLVNLKRANLDMYQGTFRNKAVIDVRKEPAKLNLTTQLKKLNLRPLLNDLEQESIPFRGKLNLVGNFNTQGTRLSQWLAHSNGKGNLRLLDGAVTGVNLSKEVCVAAASIDGSTANQQWSEDTEFTQLFADINLVNGQLNNQDLKLAIPGFEVSGFGFFHLVAQDFLYNLGIRFSEDTNQQVCTVSSNLAKVRWPVECKGSLASDSTSIRCRPDTKAVTSLVGQLLKDAAQEKAKKKIQESQDKIKDKAKNKLRGLFR
ncbi:AsmA family protein [Marinospirillum insulare]|uniref:AsmA domain-containing protein n=1 Tax=Marinospirillum insulare TaxID=217169 RepID=A0ABQ5ZUZ5_9GAMM|nr:AsmA family protein [Marinospirillum insulare]GLR63242.1 hypothetical protein GCM10007878_06770 [Marinospirillum insulare]